jgi:two-component system, chemotaxis family, protein-glutamate methylesterase/glutaminase
VSYGEIVVVGTSAGGVDALARLFSALPQDFSMPILVVMHLPSTSNVDPNLIFGRLRNGQFKEAGDKETFEVGKIYFAPPNYHMLVERDRSISLSQDDPVHFARPSIDVLFESAAQAFGGQATGVLLTGANEDGAAGLQAIGESGGRTFVQDPRQAEARSMPQAALNLFKPTFVGTIEEIALRLSARDRKGA